MNASGGLEFLTDGTVTFESNHSLILFSDLENARWHLVFTTEGIPVLELQEWGHMVVVNGSLLSYPRGRDVRIQLSIDGDVPQQFSGHVVHAYEIDEFKQNVTGSSDGIFRSISFFPHSRIPDTRTTNPSPVPLAVERSPTQSGMIFITVVCALVVAATLIRMNEPG